MSEEKNVGYISLRFEELKKNEPFVEMKTCVCILASVVVLAWSVSLI